MDKTVEYWNRYYQIKAREGIDTHSPFAESIMDDMLPNTTVLELGCGDGRDLAILADDGRQVTAVDYSNEAINIARDFHPNVEFHRINFMDNNWVNYLEHRFDYVYSRFSLHTIPQDHQVHYLLHAITLAKKKVFLECRSSVETAERWAEYYAFDPENHKRYLVDPTMVLNLLCRLRKSFKMEHSRGLAVYNNEDPMILRVIIDVSSS